MVTALWPDVQSLYELDDYFAHIEALRYGPEVIQVLLDQGHFAACLEILDR